ncbi:MAG: hypothetical protein NTW85_08260 [Methylococcales bacterium]|nr:hypothetical protein [Methylococcales bacterium]
MFQHIKRGKGTISDDRIALYVMMKHLAKYVIAIPLYLANLNG